MDFVGLAGLAIGLVSLAYAFKTNRDKARLERLVHARFQRIEEQVDNANRNAKLAYDHLDDIRRFVQELPTSSTRNSILDHIAWLHGDVTATDRLLKQVRTDFKSVRDSLADVKYVHRVGSPASPKLPPPE